MALSTNTSVSFASAVGYTVDSRLEITGGVLRAIGTSFQGTWNASTNTPTLANGVGTTGHFYECTTAGSTNFGAGAIAFLAPSGDRSGDWVYYTGAVWEKLVSFQDATAGPAICYTPAISASAWAAIHRVAVTRAESIGSEIRFLVSFDGGDSYMRFSGDGWAKLDTADINEFGNIAADFERIREWDAPDSIIFAISINRQTSESLTGFAGVPTVDLLTIHYDATGSEREETEFPGEPDVGGSPFTLSATSTATARTMPDLPLEVRVIGAAMQPASIMGYRMVYSDSAHLRRVVNARWSGRTTTERDDIVEIIETYQQEAFYFTLPGDMSARKFVFGEYETRLQDVAPNAEHCYAIESTLIEVLP